MLQKIELEEGKYTLYFNEKTGELTAQRYGQEWQDLSGNKMVYLMMQRILDLEYRLEELEED